MLNHTKGNHISALNPTRLYYLEKRRHQKSGASYKKYYLCIGIFLIFIPTVFAFNNSQGVSNSSGHHILQPPLPHLFYGYVNDSNGTPQDNATVNITNKRTNESLIVFTDSSGYYQADISNLPSGYQAGDSINITANTTTNYGYVETTVSTDAYQHIDIVVCYSWPVDELSSFYPVSLILIVLVISLSILYKRDFLQKIYEYCRKWYIIRTYNVLDHGGPLP
jgi:hypothetical protein